jgi:hypothetical protein
MRFEYKWTGTHDRGDGEADCELDPPSCPDRCGGDLSLATDPDLDPQNEVWKCSDCGGEWYGNGEPVLPGDEPDDDDGWSDVEADADTLASAGWGTDEDYGCFGGDDCW